MFGFLESLAVLSCMTVTARAAVNLSVSTSGGNASSPMLWGIMFEDINHSGDGGIHGQLLRNNGFQGTNPGLTAYSAVGAVTLANDSSTPLTAAIKSSLKVTVPSGTTGRVGFLNTGYLGVPVNADNYTTSFYIKGVYAGPVTVSLVGPTGTVYAATNITVASTASNFTYYHASFTSAQSYESNNTWQLTFDAAKVAGSSLWFDLVQLFPTTYHGRTNGLRNDLATFLEQTNPSFLRFPGGNNIEGATTANRWKWNETIGPLENRPGRQGDWTYPNTDALGLMEYMQWCIDMKMEPLLAVWSGLSIGGGFVNGSALQPYIDDILKELEFLVGNTSTAGGALRAKYGRTDPYDLKYIEIGNEDMLNGGCASYPSRLLAIYNAVQPVHPTMTFVASSPTASCLPATLPEGMWIDTHHYFTPDQFVAAFHEFDNVKRSNGNARMVGEFGSTKGNNGVHTYNQTMQGSCGEAVYMIGIERNSDWVKMASYAPLLEHYGMVQWWPDLFGFNSTVGSITGSTSYWVQYMFSTNRGDTIRPVNTTANFGPVYWVASSVNNSTYYVKLANYGNATESITTTYAGAKFTSPATLTLLSGAVDAYNLPGDVPITPKKSTVTGSASDGYTFSMPPWSVAVLAVSAGEFSESSE